jgi:hypothetical protein
MRLIFWNLPLPFPLAWAADDRDFFRLERMVVSLMIHQLVGRTEGTNFTKNTAMPTDVSTLPKQKHRRKAGNPEAWELMRSMATVVVPVNLPGAMAVLRMGDNMRCNPQVWIGLPSPPETAPI